MHIPLLTIPITRKNYFLAVLLFGGVGLFFLIYSVLGLLETKKFIQSSLKTEGIVVSNVVQKSGTYKPLIRFTTKKGESIQVVSDNAQKPAQFNTGDKISILYYQDNPNRFKINTNNELYLGYLLIGMLGSVCLLAALVVLFTKATPMVGARVNTVLYGLFMYVGLFFLFLQLFISGGLWEKPYFIVGTIICSAFTVFIYVNGLPEKNIFFKRISQRK